MITKEILKLRRYAKKYNKSLERVTFVALKSVKRIVNINAAKYSITSRRHNVYGILRVANLNEAETIFFRE